MDQPTKECPFCCETIPARAVLCRFCRSRLAAAGGQWHRAFADRKVAGVCAAIAHNFQLPPPLVRVAALALTLLHGIGLWAYLLLWVLLPAAPGEESPAERAMARIRLAFAWKGGS